MLQEFEARVGIDGVSDEEEGESDSSDSEEDFENGMSPSTLKQMLREMRVTKDEKSE